MPSARNRWAVDFQVWWEAVGQPVELAFGEEVFVGSLDFGRMMAANRREDEEAQSMVAVLDALADHFGWGKWFGVEEFSTLWCRVG